MHERKAKYWCGIFIKVSERLHTRSYTWAELLVQHNAFQCPLFKELYVGSLPNIGAGVKASTLILVLYSRTDADMHLCASMHKWND